MARTKSVKTVENKSKEIKEEIKQEAPVVEETKQETESAEVIALKQQLEEMKKAMEMLMMNQSMNNLNSSNKVVLADEEILIGCNVVQGIAWGSPDDEAGEIHLRFGEEQSVTVSDMKIFLRQSSIRKLFIDGLCYFAEPENYKLFNIKKYQDLSDERLIALLSNKNINDMIVELNQITNEKRNSSIVNCIIFRICDMIRKNTIELGYYVREAIENYFDFKLERGINTLRAIDALR